MENLYRPRRTCLSVPGSSDKMIAKAKTLPADQVFLDLEDAVAPDAKEAARANVVAAKGGEYNVDTCSSASGTSLASTDVASWLNALKGAIGRTACGGIVCRNATCDITVQWDDSRATSGKSAFSVTTRVIL